MQDLKESLDHEGARILLGIVNGGVISIAKLSNQRFVFNKDSLAW
jgi:hypothetical protein